MVAPAMLRVSWFLIVFSITTHILVARILAELIRRLRNVVMSRVMCYRLIVVCCSKIIGKYQNSHGPFAITELNYWSELVCMLEWFRCV